MEFDKNKLKHDYETYIWKFAEKAPKEDLQYLYVDLKWTVKQISILMGKGDSTIVRWLRFYKINKPVVDVNSAPITEEMLAQIDWNKVSRNFLEEPWKRSDIPIKSDFEYFFIELNWSAYDIAQLIGRSRSQVQVILRKLGIHKPSDLHQQSREAMNLRNYGTKFANATKEALKKKEETNLEKYGVKSLLCKKEFREGTMLAKHGVKHALESEKFMEKLRATNNENWGVDYTPQSFVVQEKIKQSIKNKYGVNNVFELNEVQEKAKSTNICKYGVSNFNLFHVKHLENMNKEYWEAHFYDKTIDAFDLEKCAIYHNISLSNLNKKLKEFGIDMRNKYSSINEHDIYQYILNLGCDVIHKDRTAIKPKELDIYVPTYNFAIEFDGLSFHSSGITDVVLGKNIPSDYHYNKTKQCNDAGIQLYHIFENEWKSPVQRDIWKSMICNKVHKTTKVYARKTTIVKLTNLEAQNFCNNNHLQGGCNSRIQYGLMYNNELVAVMTFSKPRYNRGYDWELLRFCCKKYTSVVGGASKLLKYFRSNYKGSIISYANLRWSKGNLYEQLGFTLLRQTKPNYFYFKVKHGILPVDMILHSRMQFQKHKLKDKLEHYDPALSECNNMYANGYRAIFDCGNLVYILN